MAAVTPHLDGAPNPVYSHSVQGLSVTSPTLVTDGDTLGPFPAYTTLTVAQCWLKRIDNSADVTFTIAALPAPQNVLTIGVNIPPLASTPVKGQVVGI